MSTQNGGCYVVYKLGEGNFRFMIILLVLILYMLTGALIFQAIEQQREKEERQNYMFSKQLFLYKYPLINKSDLDTLLNLHEEAAANGHLEDSVERWSFYGSLYFISTLVLTIGFGMTFPITKAGKLVCIFYGFFGCVLSVLTFNLFLERIIIMWTEIIKKSCHLFRKLKPIGGNKVSALNSVEEEEKDWKPSILKLIVLLTFTMTLITLSMTLLLTYTENWKFLESLYFCFITFATIGFGDLVSHQQTEYRLRSQAAYSAFNIILIFIGCACMYSLLNVLSILIKERLIDSIQFMTRKLPSCYYDPNLKVVAKRGRRHNVSFDVTSSETETTTPRYVWSRGSSISSHTQYRQNIDNIALEARSKHVDTVSVLSEYDKCVVAIDAPQDDAGVVPTKHQLEVTRNSVHNLSPEHNRHSLWSTQGSPTKSRNKSADGTEVNQKKDARKSLHKRETYIDLHHLNQLSKSRASRPKSKTSYAAKVGGMNIVTSTLQEVISPDSSESELE